MLFRSLAPVCCLALTACFDSHEELWVNPDGSARAEFRYHVPDSALFLAGRAEGAEKQIRTLVAGFPELRLDSLTFTPGQDGTEVAAKMSTDSLLWLRDLKKNPAVQNASETSRDFAGDFNVKLQGLNVDFTRTMDIGGGLGFASFTISSEERAKRRLQAIVHLPLPATETNATRIEDGGRTLIWDTPLGDALKGPLVTHFRAPVPLPKWVIPTAIAAVLALIVSVSLGVRHWRRKLQTAA